MDFNTYIETHDDEIMDEVLDRLAITISQLSMNNPIHDKMFDRVASSMYQDSKVDNTGRE